MSGRLPCLRVLVVEDQPLIAMDIKDTVELLGHKVIGPVAVLHEAVDLAANAALDCAIMDINIHGGYSYPAVDILLDRGLPVLLLSGYDEVIFPKKFRSQAYIQKPFTEERLTKEIECLYARVFNSED